MKQCTHYNKGKTKKIAFVFSCPGQEEENQERPVAGKTGENLDLLLKIIIPEFFQEEFKCRYDYRITNSSDKVYYKKKNNRTEPLISEIKKEENIGRLINELKDITDIIICFGKNRPKTALKYISENHKNELNDKVRILYSRHLGLQSLNQLPLGNNVTNRTKERIKIVAQELKDQYNKIK